jgi:hypothetical protein
MGGMLKDSPHCCLPLCVGVGRRGECLDIFLSPPR